MENSVLQVFSIIQNTKRVVNGKGTVTHYDVYKMQNNVWFERSPKFLRFQCGRIYMDIANHFYTLENLALHLLMCYLYENKVELRNVDGKNINISRDLFSKPRFLLDQQLLLEMNAQTQMNNLAEYFRINRDGFSAMYELVMHEKRFLSPYFFIRYEPKAIAEMDSDDKLNKADPKYKRFRRIIEIMAVSQSITKTN